MRQIVLYGELGKRFGKHHKFAVKNAAEAIRALSANFKGFEQYMCTAHQDNVGFKVFVGKSSLKEAQEVHNPSSQSDVIRIVPIIAGSKSAFGRILIGAVLVVASYFTGGAASSIFFNLGVGLALGGVAQLLSPPPKTPDTPGSSNKTSGVFGGPVNVSAQGAAVPVGYGRMIVGSVVVSAGIETHEEQ